MRQQIDSDRAGLGLNSLPPPAKKTRAIMNTRYLPAESPNEELSDYIPAGWTEEMLQSHTSEDFIALASDDMQKLMLRLNHDFRIGKSNSNKGFLEELPYQAMEDITNGIHEIARKASGLPPGVRAYKRAIAPLVAIVTIQNYENFGFVIYRTSYGNDTAWEAFMENLDSVMEAQMEGDWYGEGMENIKDNFLMPIEDDVSLDGGSAEDCRTRFKELRAGDYVSYGLNTGVILMVDGKSMKSMADLEFENPAHVWAVDVDYNPQKNTYPEGYTGVFEVRTHSLLHHLYVALGSGLMTPTDVWKMLENKNPLDLETVAGGGKKEHDEL